ncbi:MAG: transcription termination/antitermination protein NusG [Candidatus Sericytochromatia bacterium]|nr:transcription termination/antitermination protein NusG [Candidatus Sericytochromatia bacterium]
MAKKWYVINTYSGYEDKVKENLLRRVETMNLTDRVFHVEVPEETVVEIKDGKRVEKPRKVFPGYVLVEMDLDEESWHVVRSTPGVTSFVGSSAKPVPLQEREVRKIFRRAASKQKVQIDLHMGEHVKVISGPFAEFSGEIIEINPERGKLKVSVSIFGRATPVELEFSQVAKV